MLNQIDKLAKVLRIDCVNDSNGRILNFSLLFSRFKYSTSLLEVYFSRVWSRFVLITGNTKSCKSNG